MLTDLPIPNNELPIRELIERHWRELYSISYKLFVLLYIYFFILFLFFLFFRSSWKSI